MDAFRYQSLAAPPSYADPIPLIWRPVLPVAIFGLEGRFDTVALVDTGAIESIIPMSFWRFIDPAHRVGETATLQAANGTEFEVRYATVDLAIRLGHQVHRWSTLVGFAASRNEMVLGDAGFLRYFAVTCDRARKTRSVRLSGQLPPAIMPRPTGPMARPFQPPERSPAFRRPRRGRPR